MLHSLIIDGFSDQFEQIREFADGANYEGFRSPVDDVFYPGICADVPAFDVLDKLQRVMKPYIEVTQQLRFMRLSTQGVKPPHWAHHDASMGTYSMMLYLNRPEHCKGGTALLRHMDGQPDEQSWARDTNNCKQWDVISTCEMRPNRAFIFRSDLWHAALPARGFGSNARDGRLLYTVFFS